MNRQDIDHAARRDSDRRLAMNPSSCLALAEAAASGLRWERRGWLDRLVRVQEQPAVAGVTTIASASEQPRKAA